jgi:hypothetical protein
MKGLQSQITVMVRGWTASSRPPSRSGEQDGQSDHERGPRKVKTTTSMVEESAGAWANWSRACAEVSLCCANSKLMTVHSLAPLIQILMGV